jgi:hypothetical protein
MDKTEGRDRDRIRRGKKRDRELYDVVLSPNRQPENSHEGR